MSDNPSTPLEETLDENHPDSLLPSSSVSQSHSNKKRDLWIDLLMFVALLCLSFPYLSRMTSGDLWSDEADYAQAGTYPFNSNRWDKSDDPKQPNRLIVARHYHAPLVSYCIGIAAHFSPQDRNIRLPFVFAGQLSIGLVYLCGVALFDKRREIAIGCSLLTLYSPAFVRMGSHALPWSLIICELLAILWLLILLAKCRDWRLWLGIGGVLGLLFTTSEMFAVVFVALQLSVPFLIFPEVKTKTGLMKALKNMGYGAILFFVVVLILWPNGLFGGQLNNLKHYVFMAKSADFPVVVGGVVYQVAPRWSYLHWYWFDYRPFAVWYGLGILSLLGLLFSRKQPAGTMSLLIFIAILLGAAHRAHIIGPEYLAHCLPFLSLAGGYFILLVGKIHRALGFIALGIFAFLLVRWSPRVPLPGMDERAQNPRWRAAAAYLAANWKPEDRIIVGPQPYSIPRWYLRHVAKIPLSDNQIQALAIHAPKEDFLKRLQEGKYPYLALSSMVTDSIDLDEKTRHILKKWKVVWQSEENGKGLSRLTIYRYPGDIR